VPGSLRSWAYVLDKPASIFTARAQRILEGLSRRSAAERRPVRKATPIPQEVLRRVLQNLVRNYQSAWVVPLPVFRACIALILQYHTWVRLGDLDEIRACHISKDMVGGTEVLRITYPKRKNDQERNGVESLLFAEGGEICPVKLIVSYYERCGFHFFDGRCLDTNFLFCRTACVFTSEGKQTVSDGRYYVSVGTLLNDIRRVCGDAGYWGNIGRKSCKMTGVSAACTAGLSDEALRDKGHWKSAEMSQHYRRHTLDYLRGLSNCISLQEGKAAPKATQGAERHIYRRCQLQPSLSSAFSPPPLSAREVSPPVQLPQPVFAQPPPPSTPDLSRPPSTPASLRRRTPPPPRSQSTRISASARLFHTPKPYGNRTATGTLHNIQLASPFQRQPIYVDDRISTSGFDYENSAIRSWVKD
jgi:hypothetical protein